VFLIQTVKAFEGLSVSRFQTCNPETLKL